MTAHRTGRLSVVTGGSGFVGQHLVTALRRRGDNVRVVDIRPPDVDVGADFQKTDLVDDHATYEALRDADTVFHVASAVHTLQHDTSSMERVNVDGTRNVIRTCQAHRVPRLVYVSSASVVYSGRHIRGGDESLPYAQVSQAPYAESKIAAERRVLAADDPSGLRTCALRPHVVFGPQDRRFLPALIGRATTGRLRFQVGLGEFLSDYTYVDNLIDALLAADDALSGTCVAGGQAYFITNGEPIPFWSFVRRVLSRLELPPIIGRIPGPLVYALAAANETLDRFRRGPRGPEDGLTRFAIRYMCTHHYFSIEKARRELGYVPRIDIAEGLEKTCRHLQSEGGLKKTQTDPTKTKGAAVA